MGDPAATRCATDGGGAAELDALVNFSPVWMAETDQSATRIVDVLHAAFEALNVSSCVWGPTLLGVVRHGGHLVPWDPRVHMVACSEDLFANDPGVRALAQWLMEANMTYVPFYGGIRVYCMDDPLSLMCEEGYDYAWPHVDVYLYQRQTRRCGFAHTPGVLVQTRPAWLSTAEQAVPTQVWLPATAVEPCTPTPFATDVGMVRVPHRPDEVLRSLYGAHYADVAEAAPDHPSAEDEAPIVTSTATLRQLYASMGWRWGDHDGGE